MVGLFSTTRTASLGEKFLFFDPITQDKKTDGIDRESGYLQLELTAAQTATLAGYAGSVGGGVTNTTLGYEIIGTEYTEKPTGFSTVVGITSGYWANCAGYGAANGGYVNTGVAVTQYVVRLEDAGQMVGVKTGDFVKLPGHSMGPNLTAGVIVGMKDENNATITVANGLRVDKKIGSDRIVLTGFTTDSQSHSPIPIPNDYISIRRIFTIAKGRVGVI